MSKPTQTNRALGAGKMPGQPEFEALLLVIRPDPEALQDKFLEEISQPDFDWNLFLRLAQNHKVVPLVYTRLYEIGTGVAPRVVPEKVTDSLSQAYYANIAHTTELLVELYRLTGALQARNIPVLVLKGPALSWLAFGSLDMRQFVDLDLVIRPDQLVLASQVLKEAGYTPQFDLSPVWLQKYTGIHYELAFKHQTQPLAVDLHWSVLPAHFSFSPDSELIWKNAIPLDLGDQQVAGLGREELLLFLCAHAAKDNWSSLGAICDIAWLLKQSPDLDWEKINRLSGHLGSRRMFRLGLLLANMLLDAPLPPKILASVRSETRLAEQVRSQFLRPPRGTLGWFVTGNLYLRSMDKITDRVQYWVDEVLTPTPYEWARLELPPRFYFLYYLLRLWHFVLKYLFRKSYE